MGSGYLCSLVCFDGRYWKGFSYNTNLFVLFHRSIFYFVFGKDQKSMKEKFQILSYLDPIKVEDQKKGGKPEGNKTGTPTSKTPKGTDT